MITLATGAAVVVSGNSGAIAPTVRSISQRTTGGIFLLNVTAAATAAGDTLDVYVQSAIDGGTIWDDFIHFTQVLGNGGAVKYKANWIADILPTSPLSVVKDAALAAGVNQGPVGSAWRVKWVVVSSSSPNFSFTVNFSPVFGSYA